MSGSWERTLWSSPRDYCNYERRDKGPTSCLDAFYHMPFYSVAQSRETIVAFAFFSILLFMFLTQQGETALHSAFREEHLAVAKLLLELMTREAALSLNQVSNSCLVG